MYNCNSFILEFLEACILVLDHLIPLDSKQVDREALPQNDFLLRRVCTVSLTIQPHTFKLHVVLACHHEQNRFAIALNVLCGLGECMFQILLANSITQQVNRQWLDEMILLYKDIVFIIQDLFLEHLRTAPEEEYSLHVVVDSAIQFFH